MSGLAGMYNLNGDPVDAALVARMSHRVAHRGPDALRCWVNGPVGIGHALLQTTPESVLERQPWLDESATLCLALDGRIDNREDLIQHFATSDVPLRNETDAELVLRAYQQWGEQCLEHLVGDFALVVWDGQRRQLFCARDILGLKPFYYCRLGTSFYWASEIPPLFECAGIPRRPHDAMVAEFLSGIVVTNRDTLYEGIHRLEPAHSLIVRPEGIVTHRYWTIDSSRRIHYSCDDDYAQHFLQIFDQAVRCRLRSHRPIGLGLSGGLDSSAVVSMVQQYARSNVYESNRFQTFSLVFPALPCDERPYIDDVVNQGTFPPHYVTPPPPTLEGFVDDVRRYQDLPDHPNGAMHITLRTLARRQGCRVLLTGSGGDEWLTGSFFHYADLLRNLNVRALIRRLRADRPLYCDRPTGDFFSIPFVQCGLLPLIPQSYRDVGKQLLGRTNTPDWLSTEFWHRTHMEERIRQAVFSPACLSYAQRDLFSSTTHGLGIHGTELDERAASFLSLENRHPLNDRRIIEFALALPEDQRWRDKPKFVLRNAVGKFLPSSVRTRVLKADFSCMFAQALLAESMATIFQSLSVASMGWVDGKQILADYQTMARCYQQGDEAYRFHVAPLWMVFGVELWFRILFSNDPVPSHPGTRQATIS